ncbi:N-6 DNA methylase [Sphaerisporangium sp. NPDC049002]|uniref:N-6 DNA methylase n=1 Tax=unclassified Sphaerisporangium TaxID=2630420 RepID=UPI0033D8C518
MELAHKPPERWQDEVVEHRSEQLTAAEISRLAGVTRATVSNWRRRHPDFPQPSGGTEASPTYDREAVESWLAARNQLPEASPLDELRAELRKLPRDVVTEGVPAVVRAALRMDAAERGELDDLPDEDFLRRVRQAVREQAAGRRGTGHDRFTAFTSPGLRAVLRSMSAIGAVETLELLHEWQPADTGVRGLYSTPEQVADLMAALIAERPYPASVFDPACGTGGLLAAASRRGAAHLFGQDVAALQADQAAIRLSVLTPEAEIQVRSGDSLRDDAFPGLTVDAVLCNPPYADREWGHDALGYDPRWAYGVPSKGESELAWVQHCLAHLDPGRTAVILLPPAVAERPGGRKIRAELVRRGAVRAVASLPPGTAPPLHVGLHLWILQRPAGDKGEASSVLFVDTASDELSGENQDGLFGTVLQQWRGYVEEPEGFTGTPGVARAVPVLELVDEAVDLSPSRHVRTGPVAGEPDWQAENARSTRLRLRRAIDALALLSQGEDWKPAGAKPATWRTATVADLVRGGAIDLHRARSIRDRQPPGHGASSEHDDTPVLTAGDVTASRAASGTVPASHFGEVVEIRRGDVLLPEMVHGGPSTARVADQGDAGALLGPHLHLFRPDLDRLDPWFLAGFLSAEDNLNSNASGSTITRVDARRLRVPLLPLDEQRRYGKAFRRMVALRRAADLAVRLAAETARQHDVGLTSGAVLPPEE